MRSNTNERSVKSIIYPALLINLYVNPSLEDPFNAPKQWILFIFSAWLLAHITIDFFYEKDAKYKFDKNFIRITLFFIFCLFISALYTDQIYTAFIGDAYRKLGFFTYLSLAIIMIASSMYVNNRNILEIFPIIIFLSMILVIYGFLQSVGRDFFAWNNPYNNVIGTVGNPNFASANFAILAVLSAGFYFNHTAKLYSKIFLTLVIIMLLFIIIKSDSRQGLISASIGFVILVFYKLITHKRIYGILFGFFISGIFVLTILGMLQQGPLAKYVYKDSVSVRGFYWRAGISMFRDNILTGVGIERYGANFKLYRELDYPLRYGFDITSTNAHNVPIQFFATGGLFVGILYLIIQVYIFYKAIKFIIANKKNSSTVVCLLAAWLTYLSQSFISIDNIGVTVWGWIIGGFIIGLTSDPINSNIKKSNLGQKNKTNIKNLQLVLAVPLCLIAVVLSSMLYRGEIMTIYAKSIFDYKNNIQSVEFISSAERILNLDYVDDYYKLQMATLVGKSGDSIKSQLMLDKILQSDSRCLDCLLFKAYLLEYNQKYFEAIEVRNKISKIDPWNAKNYLELGRDFKNIENLAGTKLMFEKISSFAKSSPEYNLAKLELNG